MSSDELELIEPDSSEAVDSDYESVYSFRAGDGTTSVSLASAVTDYKFEHGRRYNAYREGSYHFPNDDLQTSYMDQQHHSWRLKLKGELYLAPIENPEGILDLGTGTGIWVLDMAEKFPSARIMGNDLSPIQPTYVPANVTFEVDDFNDEWTYPESSFDFVHGRGLYGSVDKWPKLMKSAMKVLRPGGWYEAVELDIAVFCDDGTMDSYPILNEWVDLIEEACVKQGRSLKVATRMHKVLEETGFENVQHRIFKMPLGPWARDVSEKEVGYWQLLSMLDGVEGFTLALFTRNLGWAIDDAKEYAEKVRTAMSDKRLHSYAKGHIAYGQKPMNGAKPPSP